MTKLSYDFLAPHYLIPLRARTLQQQREGERERVALAERVVAVEERAEAVDLKSRNDADGECIDKIVALASEYAGTDREGWALDYAFFWSGKLHGAEDQKSRDFVLRLFEKAKAGGK